MPPRNLSAADTFPFKAPPTPTARPTPFSLRVHDGTHLPVLGAANNLLAVLAEGGCDLQGIVREAFVLGVHPEVVRVVQPQPRVVGRHQQLLRDVSPPAPAPTSTPPHWAAKNRRQWRLAGVTYCRRGATRSALLTTSSGGISSDVLPAGVVISNARSLEREAAHLAAAFLGTPAISALDLSEVTHALRLVKKNLLRCGACCG